MINLSIVTPNDWQAVAMLAVTEEQTRFVAYNSYSLAQACYESESYPYAIYHGAELVGFALIQKKEEIVWILRLMIDRRYQGKGYGREALNQICRLFPGQTLRTSYVPDNAVAARLYKSSGFIPTGEIEDDEVVVQHERPSKPDRKK